MLKKKRNVRSTFYRDDTNVTQTIHLLDGSNLNYTKVESDTKSHNPIFLRSTFVYYFQLSSGAVQLVCGSYGVLRNQEVFVLALKTTFSITVAATVDYRCSSQSQEGEKETDS